MTWTGVGVCLGGDIAMRFLPIWHLVLGEWCSTPEASCSYVNSHLLCRYLLLFTHSSLPKWPRVFFFWFYLFIYLNTAMMCIAEVVGDPEGTWSNNALLVFFSYSLILLV